MGFTVVAVIPAYNEEKTIAVIVQATRDYCNDIVVVDDGSTDKTSTILSKIGVRYIVHEKNMGVGVATRNGIESALSLGADIVVTLDGDGQHDPIYIPSLLSCMREHHADVVVGSRFLGKRKSSIPAYRSFGIKVIMWFYNAFRLRYRLTDALCCLRAYSRQALEKFDIEESGFGFCPEMLLKAQNASLVIAETRVRCIYHKKYSRNSTFSPIRLGVILVWKVIYWRVKLWARRTF